MLNTPSPKRMTASWSSRSSRPFASRTMARRSSFPAMCAALPVTKVCRDAEVLPQSGVTAVSPEIRSKHSTGAHKASAQICVTIVVDPEFDGEIVIELFLRDCHLRHAEATKCAGRNNVGVDGPRQRPVVRDRIRSGSMHRNARRNRRSPGRISAGVEISAEVKGKQFAVLVRPGAAAHARRMALWRWPGRLHAGI